MRNGLKRAVGAALATAGAMGAGATAGTSDIDSAHKHSWGENIGWMNWRDADGGMQGVRVLATHLDGRIWAENAGWISVGAPGAGPYANTNGGNYGVNIEAGTGRLTGHAWSENFGWLNFSLSPAILGGLPHYDSAAGRFRGWVWGENAGWIKLDDAVHYVGVVGCAGDIDGDGAVSASDLALLLGAWGGAGAADLNDDGVVNAADLALLLGAWGPC